MTQNYGKTGSEKIQNVIGVMSGTSVDGLDIALCEFEESGKSWKYRIIDAETIIYEKVWRKKLLNIIRSKPEEIFITDLKFGEYIGEKVLNFIRKRNTKVHLIASHGHTVFHQPSAGITVQIGDGIAINRITGIPVINDFRKLDVQLGGQGAPLVPVGDALLFRNYDFCLNLGGFSNFSFQSEGSRYACDICPVNIVLNYLSRKSGMQFDEGGRFSASGKLNIDLFNKLNEMDFYRLPRPKSLGLEWVQESVFPLLDSEKSDLASLMHTYTRHISFQITNAIRENPVIPTKKSVNVLTTGGGAYNHFLTGLLQEYGKGDITYVIPEKILVDYKEALIFAFLGLLRFMGKINIWRSVTGASADSCSGVLHQNSVSGLS